LFVAQPGAFTEDFGQHEKGDDGEPGAEIERKLPKDAPPPSTGLPDRVKTRAMTPWEA
jgi:hypothetical protein